MPPTFIGSAPGNFLPGRPVGFTPEAIVLHRTGGSRDSLRARFNDPAAFVSAHYVVCRDGRVDQYVLESGTAFHAGTVVSPTWPRLRPQVNPNFYTIGIELEGTQADDWPEDQIQATATLIAEVARRWHLAVDREHVVAHSAIRAPRRCPADLNWWPRKSKDAPEFTTKFCGLDETDRYVKVAYRQKDHFASFPGVQVDAVAALVRGLCRQFSIPATIPPLARRFECDLNAFATYTGVCTHANFRRDKWDIGPAFPWDRLGL